MLTRALTSVLLAAAMAAPSLSAQQASTPGIAFSVGGMAGWADGTALQLFAVAQRVGGSIPLQARLRLGWDQVDPGNSLDARRVFINDATNGTPQKWGRTADVALDVLVGTRRLPGDEAFWVLGVRHSFFLANFRYVGANEEFTIRSTPTGFGAGGESRFRLGSATSLVVDAGLDYFLATSFEGHDTSYEPNGQDINPREGYAWKDADAAINQPRLRPMLAVGLQRRLQPHR